MKRTNSLRRTAPTTHPTAPVWDDAPDDWLILPLCPRGSYQCPNPADAHAKSRLGEGGAGGGGTVARDDRGTATTVQYEDQSKG